MTQTPPTPQQTRIEALQSEIARRHGNGEFCSAKHYERELEGLQRDLKAKEGQG